MEDIKQYPTREYVERFNQGYIIAKQFPELADYLRTELEKTDGFLAFKSGMDEYALEESRERRLGWLNKERSLDNNGLSKDMDELGKD